MVGNDLLRSDNNQTTHESLLAQCNHVATSNNHDTIDVTQVALQDVESCKLVGGIQRCARVL